MTTNSKYLKRVYDTRTFNRFLYHAFSNLGDMRNANQNGVDRQFGERIMLAVTEVNGCRYCSYFHSRQALMAGVTQEEIDALLCGEQASAPQDQKAALLFAQHYAESAGAPDEAAVIHLNETYGAAKASAIIAYIRMIMIGNAYGNSFDALRHRLRGKPAPSSTLGQELGVLIGSIFLTPWYLISGVLITSASREERNQWLR